MLGLRSVAQNARERERASRKDQADRVELISRRKAAIRLLDVLRSVTSHSVFAV